MERILAVIIVLIIILAYWHQSQQLQVLDSTLSGFWKADKKFCDEAGITELLVYIGPDHNNWFSETRTAHIIMTGRDAVIYDGTVTLNLGMRDWISKTCYERQMTITEPESDGYVRLSITEVMTSGPIDVYIDMGSGCMVWRDEDTKFAVLYRDWVEDPRE